MRAPHKHAQAIKDWADGYEIEYQDEFGGGWYVAKTPCWGDNIKYRRKTEIPKSGLTDEQLNYINATFKIVNDGPCPIVQSWRAIADASVKHFILIDMQSYLATQKGEK